MINDKIIDVQKVSFSYSGRPDERVLENVDLEINRGDYLGIIGPNGGGKTTLLKLILGLLQLSQGSIKLFGKDLDDFRDQTKIGYVPQKATNFDSHFPATVYEVVAMGRYAKKGPLNWINSADNKIIESVIAEVGMSAYKDRLIGELSGGQQQKVFIARALATEPEIIFLDEPTTGIDQKSQEEFYQLLKKFNRDKNITLVLVSHDVDVVAKEVTKIACINKTLIYDGDPKKFDIKSLENFYNPAVQLIKHTHHGH